MSTIIKGNSVNCLLFLNFSFPVNYDSFRNTFVAEVSRNGPLEMANILKQQNFISDINYYAFLGFRDLYNRNYSAILLVDLFYEDLKETSIYSSFIKYAKNQSFLYETYGYLIQLS